MRSTKVWKGLVPVACAVVLLISAVVMGESIKSMQADTAKTAPQPKQLKSQTTCPVSGDKIDRNHYVDHNGKRIYLCCADCLAQVKKDPEKYIRKLESQGQSVETISDGAKAKKLNVIEGKTAKMDMKATKLTGDTSVKAAEAAYWTCTMHPQVRKAESGNCPICGMKLVFRENNTADTTKTNSKDTTATKGADRSKMKM